MRVSWLNIEPRSRCFPAIQVAIATCIAFATIFVFSMYSNSILLIPLIDNSVPQNQHILSYRINKHCFR